MPFCKMFSTIAALILGFCTFGVTVSAQTSTNNYNQTNLVADTSTVTPAPAHVDANLVNPWGIAFFPGGPFWINDNNSGFSTLYDQTGMLQGTFTIPPPAGSTAAATPTGIVANLSQTGFIVGGKPSLFIFDTEDGTISGWNGGATVILAVDNSMGGAGAVYKGLAMITNNGANFLLATNFRSGKVEVYDSNFKLTNLSGTFTDPNLPAGYAPFGIHVITANSQTKIYVTYALQDAAKHDPVHAAGDGVVDIFDTNGNMIQTFVMQGDMHTNAPWGVVVPPAGFGAFAGDVLVGNFGDGVLNAYMPAGTFIDSVKDAGGNVITNLSLWDLVFGGGGAAGDANTLYLTAGGMAEMHGVFASLVPTQASGGNTPDFSVSVSPTTATVTAGASSNFTINTSPTNGFNSAVSLSCSGLPTGAKCMFSTQSYTPGGSTIPMLTITTSARSAMMGAVPSGQLASRWPTSQLRMLLAAGFVGFLLVGLYFGRLRLGFFSTAPLRAGGLAVILLAVFAAAGCGSGKAAASTGTPAGTSMITVTATSGTLSHSATITLTVK
ncbi:MAG TPA: TIGR03118 family protein [Candidatus Dormibacteraeota bacterium]|nr:TIGR03118 family protein [Candidatus Dormibacteraeota bacterium]